MEFLCSKCSIQLSKFEIELNELYPIGRLYCEFCQNKHERKLIKKLKKSIESDLDIYDYPKYIVKLKKRKKKNSKNLNQLVRNLLNLGCLIFLKERIKFHQMKRLSDTISVIQNYNPICVMFNCFFFLVLIC